MNGEFARITGRLERAGYKVRAIWRETKPAKSLLSVGRGKYAGDIVLRIIPSAKPETKEARRDDESGV